MLEFDKIIKGIISESLSERADELAGQIFNKIESNEDVDKYDLEVGTDYGFDDDDEDFTFTGRGKKTSDGPFYFKRNSLVWNLRKMFKDNGKVRLDFISLLPMLVA